MKTPHGGRKLSLIHYSRQACEHSIVDTAAAGARFPLPVAADADAPPNDVRRYSLTAATAPTPFRLEQSPLARELYLVLTGPLDRERAADYALAVTAVDGGAPRRSATLAVRVQVTVSTAVLTAIGRIAAATCRISLRISTTR